MKNISIGLLLAVLGYILIFASGWRTPDWQYWVFLMPFFGVSGWHFGTYISNRMSDRK